MLAPLMHRFLYSCLLAATLGCSMQPPATDRNSFKPMPEEIRQMRAPTIKYLLRPDASFYCAQITGNPVTPTSRPMACSFWNIQRQECSIVTLPETAYNYIGHELRHCFEGAFHV